MLKRTSMFALAAIAAATIAATAAISTGASAHGGGHGHGGHGHGHGHAHGHAHGGHAHWHAHGGHAHGHRWSRHGSFSHFNHYNHYGHFAHYQHGHYRWAGRAHWRGRAYWWRARYHRWYYPGVGGTDAPAAYDGRPADGDSCLVRRYLPNGRVSFDDVCAKEEVVTSQDDAMQAAPSRPCAEIVAACRQAGFVQGGAGAGNGLQLDCIAPIIQGTPQPRRASQPLPQIAPQLVAACKARNPNFGQRSAARLGAAAEPEIESGFPSGPRER
jgi:hypothetical protein